MTPDFLHFGLLVAGWIGLPVLLAATLLVHRRLRSAASLCLLCGVSLIVVGRGVQTVSPVNDVTLEEFRGVIVSQGRFPVSWYVGSAASAAGLLLAAGGALAVAIRLRS